MRAKRADLAIVSEGLDHHLTGNFERLDCS